MFKKMYMQPAFKDITAEIRKIFTFMEGKLWFWG